VRVLHIVNGDMVAEKLKDAVYGDILVWREAKSSGTVAVGSGGETADSGTSPIRITSS